METNIRRLSDIRVFTVFVILDSLSKVYTRLVMYPNPFDLILIYVGFSCRHQSPLVHSRKGTQSQLQMCHSMGMISVRAYTLPLLMLPVLSCNDFYPSSTI